MNSINNLKLLLNRKRIKQLFILFWPLILMFISLSIMFLLINVGKDSGWKTTTSILLAIALVVLFYIQLVVIYFYFTIYLKNKNPFFIFYSLFFIL